MLPFYPCITPLRGIFQRHCKTLSTPLACLLRAIIYGKLANILLRLYHFRTHYNNFSSVILPQLSCRIINTGIAVGRRLLESNLVKLRPCSRNTDTVTAWETARDNFISSKVWKLPIANNTFDLRMWVFSVPSLFVHEAYKCQVKLLWT